VRLLVFFKNSCPTCQLALPVYGELERRYGDALPVVAVAQDPARSARPWLDQRGFTGPLADDSGAYTVSNRHDVTTVPTMVLVDDDGTAVARSEGWDRDRANAWDEELARLTGRESPGPLSTPDDGLPAFKPG